MKKRIQSILTRSVEKVPCKWRGRDIAVIFLLVFAAPFLTGIPLYLAVGSFFGHMVLVAAQPVLSFYLVWLCLNKRYGLELSEIGFQKPAVGLKSAVAVTAVLFGMDLGIINAGMHVMDMGAASGPDANLPAFYRNLHQGVYVFAGLVAGPAAEEAMHRGLVYKWLRSKTTLLRAVALQAVVFSLLHFDISPEHPFLPFVLHFSSGILYAAAFELTGTLYAAIILHGAVNLSSMLIQNG